MALLLFTGFLIGVACNIPNSFTPVSSAPELELLDELELLLESEGALLELEELLELLSEEALELPFEAEPLEPLFPPPPPPPLHAVNIETDTAAASTMAMTYTRVYTIESKDEYGNVKSRNYTDSTNGVRTYQEDDYSFVLSDAEQGKAWFIWKDNLLPTTVQPYKPSEKLDTDSFWRQAEMVEGKYKFGSTEYDAEALIQGRLEEPTNTFHKDIQIACFSKGKKYPDYILYVDEVLGDDEPVITLQMVEQNKEFYTEAVEKYMDFEKILSNYT